MFCRCFNIPVTLQQHCEFCVRWYSRWVIRPGLHSSISTVVYKPGNAVLGSVSPAPTQLKRQWRICILTPLLLYPLGPVTHMKLLTICTIQLRNCTLECWGGGRFLLFPAGVLNGCHSYQRTTTGRLGSEFLSLALLCSFVFLCFLYAFLHREIGNL